jgi:PAS domain S-box-containing protein
MNQIESPWPGAARHCLSGGGEMGALMRSIDWADTSIGAVESWSPTLLTMVSFLLANRFQMLLWWGSGFCQLYNDAFRPFLGTKHPRSMGQLASDCWAEIWDIIGPLIETPFLGGGATGVEDLVLEIQRHGFAEETHWNVSSSAVADATAPTGIGGVAATVHEITEKVVGERRIVLLRDLGARSYEAKTAEDACSLAAETLSRYPKDIPFALLYLIDTDRTRARLAGAAGIDPAMSGIPTAVDFAGANSNGQLWLFAEAQASETMQLVEDLQNKLAEVPPGPWPDRAHSAVVFPVPSNTAHQFSAFLVLGISSRLRFDSGYQAFCELVTSQVATAIVNARTYQEERKRVDLPEADHAETDLFSNDIHEFRKPFVPITGPPAAMMAAGERLQRSLDALRDSEERWKAVFDHSASGIALTDMSGHFLSVNAAYQRMLGYSQDEFRSLSLTDITHKDDQAANDDAFAELVKGRTQDFQIEKRCRNKNGFFIWTKVHVSLISNLRGGPPLALAVAEDITESKGEQDKLRESERRFRMLLEAIPHHVWSFRTDGTLGYWNQRLVDYTGLTGDQLKQGGWDALHPDDQERVREAWHKAWSQGSRYEVEQRVRGRDGCYRRFLCRAVPAPDQSGKPVEWFGTNTDIEDRKRAEEELRDAHEKLAHITRVTIMGELSTSIAHELNQPLTAIAMDGNACLQWLNRVEPNLGETRAAVIRMINEATRAGRVIGKMRALMRNSPPELSEVDINGLITDVVTLTRHQLLKHNVSLRTDLSPELRSPLGDAVQLQQVIVNLVINAIEATSARSDGPREILLSSKNRGTDEIQVLVRDSGVGLDPRSPQDVFKPFVTGKPGGLGMGLSISDSIVKAHGGRLWAEPNEDGGATFLFCLPARNQSYIP